jgi:hypothetical protein
VPIDLFPAPELASPAHQDIRTSERFLTSRQAQIYPSIAILLIPKRMSAY